MKMNDITNNEYGEIRLLLARYYDGTSSQAETLRLAEFFAHAGTLPADLEADRVLFESMYGLCSEPAEIPAGLLSRIDAALEAEMAGDREPAADDSVELPAGAAPRHGVWRRRLLTAVAAAACLAALVTTVRTLMYVPDISDTRPREAIVSAADTARLNTPLASAVAPQAEDTLITAIAPGSLTACGDRPAPVAARKKTARKAPGDNKPAVYKSENYPAEGFATSGFEAEEERLMAANYHVVDDEHEAYAMVNSIFSRLEGNMMRESNRLDDIGDNYEMEVTRISY